MSIPTPSSLTGSECGPPPATAATVSVALGRLRSGLRLCTWVVGLALLGQIVIWGLVSFTQIRWTEVQSDQAAPLVVSTTAAPVRGLGLDPPPPPDREPVDPNRVPSSFDHVLTTAGAIVGGAGRFAALLLVPIVGLGVLLGSGGRVRGVDQTVSAFGWALVVAMLVLPSGALLGLPWTEGALVSYPGLVAQVDALDAAASGDAGRTGARVVFYARNLLLPLACLAGLLIIGTRFEAGVAAGVLRKEDLRLDAALESEAGNIKAGSLHGGRAAAALQAAAVAPAPPAGSTPQGPATPGPSAKQLSAGKAPKRLI